ncbi:MAG: AzlC family ABC transporter permease, partial [Thermoguttaceae bacterium]|nr:AzlC family ABC transporter permease [Thermoguttaceae bacterium]
MKKTVRAAFVTSLPVMAGYLALGFGFGVLLAQAGYGPLWALAMSVTIYAGAMQYLAVDLLANQAPLVATAIATFMVNARHIFYGVTMIEKYRNAGKYKPYIVF